MIGQTIEIVYSFLAGVTLSVMITYIATLYYKRRKDKAQKEFESTGYYKAQQIALDMVEDVKNGNKGLAKVKFNGIEVQLKYNIGSRTQKTSLGLNQ